jgi:hypothetical protein
MPWLPPLPSRIAQNCPNAERGARLLRAPPSSRNRLHPIDEKRKVALTVRLELKPDVEANLAAQARARGVALDAYLQRVIEDLAGTEAAHPAKLQEIEAALDALAHMGRGLPHLPSSAFSRESIYRDHD